MQIAKSQVYPGKNQVLNKKVKHMPTKWKTKEYIEKIWNFKDKACNVCLKNK